MFRRASLKALIASTVVVGLIAVTGCSSDTGNADATPTARPTNGAASNGTAPPTAIPAGFEQWFDQQIAWGACDDGAVNFECATVSAPLSWHDPAVGEIELALRRHLALTETYERQGSVLINPGGPGGSGVDFVEMAPQMFGARLLDAFDIVGFDPRGVGQSSQVRCLDDAAKDAALSADFDYDDAGLEAARVALAYWAQACLDNTGDLLGNVDTQSAARDMDLLRHLLGEERLNFLGFSYGTQLGATYAGLFPSHVGAMVLDGGVDLTLTSEETSKGQAIGFENALRAYVTDCLAGPNCPLTGSVDDGLAQVRAILDEAFINPIPTTGNRVLTQTLAFFGMAVTLYDEASWPFLSQGIDEVLTSGTGNILMFLADFYFDRNPDGSFSSNTPEAFRAIGCLDGRASSDMDVMRALAAEIEAAAPTMGTFFGFGGLTCADWPFPVVAQEFDLTAAGAAPIVVIGTTGDPATPFEWSVGLANTLESGVLLTFEGEGHTAYGRSNRCIVDAVDAFFIDGVVPAAGKTC